MGSYEIREPKQIRSIEKKRKIMEAGFRLFCEKGYYNTNTAEIAREAGVSTGIVYNYYSDKKDIFMEAITSYMNNQMQPLYIRMEQFENMSSLSDMIRGLIDLIITSHSITRKAHDELTAMSIADNDVREFNCKYEMDIANHIVDILKKKGITPTNPIEKALIAMSMIEKLCHEIVYHHHDYMKYDVMKEEVIKAIIKMMES